MKYNKGFAPLVIVAIVLGFLAVGSGAYLLGKNQNNNECIVKIDNNQIDLNNQEETSLYETPCNISSISGQAFSFSYPKNYLIKETIPLKGQVPLGGVMNVEIQSKNGSGSIIIGAIFEACEYTGHKLCKGVGNGYGLYTDSDNPEIVLVYNKILSTIRLKEKKDCIQNESNSNWITDSKSGLTYSSEWEVVPQTYGTPAQIANGVDPDVVGYLFTLPSGNTIMWGGNQSSCSLNEYAKFKYGVSASACVKGVITNVGPKNVRFAIPIEDIKLFGDFVLKNQ